MLKFLALIKSILFLVILNGQVGLHIDYPYEDTSFIEGFYGDSTSGWGFNSLDNLENRVQGMLVLAYDSISGSSTVCNGVLNEAEVNGNIAVIDRSECQFGVKAKKAQNAGAIGVVIISHELIDNFYPHGGDSGILVTIPTILIDYDDGVLLKSLIAQNNFVLGTIGLRSNEVVCENFIINDTTQYSVLNTGSYPIEDRILLDKIDTVSMIGRPCDSITFYYSKFVFREDIIFDTIVHLTYDTLDLIDTVPFYLDTVIINKEVYDTIPFFLDTTVINIYRYDTIPFYLDTLYQTVDDTIVIKVEEYLNNINDEEVKIGKVYPNPAKDKLCVELNSNNNYSITLYSITGTLITQENDIYGVVEIDISNLNTGLYYLDIIYTNQVLKSIKVMVK